MKFGGTSVGSPARMCHVASLVTATPGRKIVVLSAMSGTTNALVEICDMLAAGRRDAAADALDGLRSHYHGVAGELLEAADARRNADAAVDRIFDSAARSASAPFCDDRAKEILALGELLSTSLFHEYLLLKGIDAALLPALDFMTTGADGAPRIDLIAERLNKLLSGTTAAIIITQGYICTNHRGAVDNLQRGGSDYTATIIGAATDADCVEIWTDIDGMHTGDPRRVSPTCPVPRLSFAEALVLARAGAKILHPDCILPAMRAGVAVKLLNTLVPEAPGTTIGADTETSVKAVAVLDGMTLLRVKSTHERPDALFMHDVLTAISATQAEAVTVADASALALYAGDERADEALRNLPSDAISATESNVSVITVAGGDTAAVTAAMGRSLADKACRTCMMATTAADGCAFRLAVPATDADTVLKSINNILFNHQ